MKIVHVLGWYFPDSVGGTEVYVEGLCRRLQDAGHEVLIAAPDPRRTAPDQYEYKGVPVFRYPISDRPTRDEAYHRVSMPGAAHFASWLAAERPDILHVHSLKTGIGLPEIRDAHRLGVRIITTCHLPGLGYLCRTGELLENGARACDGVVQPAKCAACSLMHVGLPSLPSRLAAAIPPWMGSGLRVLPGRTGTVLGMSALVVEYRSMQRELMNLIERFVVLNDIAYRMLLADGSPAEKLAINRLGLGQSGVTRKPGPESRPTRRPVHFAFAGRLHAAKGLMTIVRAVRAIPREIDFLVDIRAPVLDAAAREIHNELRRALDDDPRVRFQPAVDSSEIPRVLAEVDVLLSPSLWFENGPTIALEAMAVGTPVIASRIGNPAELIEDGVSGRLVKPGDVAELSAALLEAATSPHTTVDVWRRALPTVRTMDEVARDYLTLYAA